MKYPKLQHQQGFTLVISLIILVALTMLGLTSTHSTRTEMAMAGNLQESDFAFQAAEIGLKSAETFVENSVSKTDFNNPSTGLYSLTDLDPDYFDQASWAGVQDSSATIADIHQQPRFIIKYLMDRSQNEVAKVNIAGYGSAQPGITVSNFRVTSQGMGQTDSAPRMLQSYYGRAYN